VNYSHQPHPWIQLIPLWLQLSSSNPAPPRPRQPLRLCPSPVPAPAREFPGLSWKNPNPSGPWLPVLAGFLACAPVRRNSRGSSFPLLTPGRAGPGRSIGGASSLPRLPLLSPPAAAAASPSPPVAIFLLEPFLVLLRRQRLGGEDQYYIFL